MSTDITPPIPASLTPGIQQVDFVIESHATGADIGTARGRARTRARRGFANFDLAFQKLNVQNPPRRPGDMGAQWYIIEESSKTEGLVAYVRATYKIKVHTIWVRR